MIGDIPNYFYGYLGAACALVLASYGALYGISKSALGIFSLERSIVALQKDENEIQLLPIQISQTMGTQKVPQDEYRELESSNPYPPTQNNSHLLINFFLPAILSGTLAIYGFIIGVIIFNQIPQQNYPSKQASSHLAAGLSVGLVCMISGIGVGSIAQNGINATCRQVKVYVPMVWTLIYTYSISLYGFLAAHFLTKQDEIIN